jgi:hypothetical protein
MILPSPLAEGDEVHEPMDWLTARIRSCKTQLGRALIRLMAKKRLKAIDIARLTLASGRGLVSAQPSRLLRGHQAHISPEDLGLIVAALRANPREWAELVGSEHRGKGQHGVAI